jgi:D-xylonolactonase
MIELLRDDVGTPNGMGFTRDRCGFYQTDTRRYDVYRFAYDRSTGAITNQQVFAHVSKDDCRGRPDGLTVDEEGCVWSARWDGFGIARYAPDGTQLAWYDLPARNVSSITFGGADLGDLYITTAIGSNPAAAGEHAGALFHMRPGVRGVPEFRSRIGL